MNTIYIDEIIFDYQLIDGAPTTTILTFEEGCSDGEREGNTVGTLVGLLYS